MLVDLALNHPKIGIGQVKVPQSFSLMQQVLEAQQSKVPYMKWCEYNDMGISSDIHIYTSLRLFKL